MFLENLVIDAVQPQMLGRFWEAALRGERLMDKPDGFETRITIEGGPALDVFFQRVPEPPAERPRLHLDLLGGAGPTQEVERLVGLGARHLDIGQLDVPWVVLADPAGNPCCVMEDRPAYADTGPIAALPLDSAEPDRDAAFWSWLTGWTDVAGVAVIIAERGGRELHPKWGELPWRIYADPSGNEFCVLPARPREKS